MPRQFSLKTLLWLMAVVGALLALAVSLWPHIQVTVENNGQRSVCELVVHVTGRSYPLGDLPPGASKNVIVAPSGESSIVIEFQDETGHKFQSDAGEYIEPGYNASIIVSITNGVVDSWRPGVRY